MSYFQSFALWTAFAHGAALALYNKYRINRILHFAHSFRGNVLHEKEALALVAKYSSPFSALQFFPDRTTYPRLYEEQAFFLFYRRSKLILVYLYSVLVMCWLYLFTLSH